MSSKISRASENDPLPLERALLLLLSSLWKGAMGPRSPESPAYHSSPREKMGRRDESPGGDGNSVCENSCSVATPSSVHLLAQPLVRDLSDLSGSYVNGSPLPPSGRGGIPRNIFGSPRDSPLTVRQPWRQAHSLSSPAPETDGPKMPILNASGTDEMIMVERNGGVEVMTSQLDIGESSTPEKMPLELAESESHERCPIVIVLMNPGYKSYELMQLWLDPRTDTVRDVLQTLRQSLPNTWNQDYDGLAQFRRDRFSQLINVLRISQFGVVPFEIWIAKPWALSTEHTAKYAENLLEHLQMVGVITGNGSSSTESPPSVGDVSTPDGVLTLSEEAKRRIHAPDGILTHHHAIQYLSFGPPFEKPFERPPIFPSSVVAITKRQPVSTSPTPARAPPSPIRSPSPQPSLTSLDFSTGSTNFYTEFDIQSGVPQARESPARAPSPHLLQQRAMSPANESFSSSVKSPDAFSTDASTQESQDWDDGTVKMASNLRDGYRRFSLQKIASQCELTLNRRRSSTNMRVNRLGSLRSCFAGMNCARRMKDDEAVERDGLSSEEITAQDSAYSLSIGNDDNSLGQHLLTLYEVEEEEDDRSMANMPLLSTSRGIVFDKFDEYAC